MKSRLVGTPLTPAEAATVARFDAAPDAEESLRERVARAIAQVYVDAHVGLQTTLAAVVPLNRAQADAAIAVVRPQRLPRGLRRRAYEPKCLCGHTRASHGVDRDGRNICWSVVCGCASFRPAATT